MTNSLNYDPLDWKPDTNNIEFFVLNLILETLCKKVKFMFLFDKNSA